MVKYKEIKNVLENKAFQIFEGLEFVEKEKFELKYINKHKLFNIFFEQIKEELELWVESLNTDIEKNNLKLEPNYALIHHMSKNIYPEDFDETVCILIIDDYKLERFDFNREEIIERAGEFNFDNWYGSVISEYFTYELDEDISKLIDRTEMLNDFKTKPLEELSSISENWEEIFYEEIGLASKAFLIALGQATYDIVFNSINENKNLLEGNK